MGLTKSQKALVAQFQTVTGSSAKVAQQCLQAANWKSDVAFNDYLDYGGESTFNPPSASDPAKIRELFDRYRDRQHQDMMLAEGIEALCQDLQVDPADVTVLVLCYHMAAENSCEFTRQEFMSGLEELECDSISKLKNELPALRRELKDPDKFYEIYNYTYSFACEKGQKCLQLDMAIAMWQLLFAERPWPLLDTWCSFLQEHHKRAISRDTWVQLLEFVMDVRPDLSNFDQNAATSAWPYLIDDFVELLRSKRETSSSDSVMVIE